MLNYWGSYSFSFLLFFKRHNNANILPTESSLTNWQFYYDYDYNYDNNNNNNNNFVSQELHHPPMMDSRHQSGHRHATANAVVFANAPDKETVSNSKCTIPFGLPPLTEATCISENHFANVNATPCPAKRNLGLARAGENEKRTPPANAHSGEFGIPFCNPVLTSHCLP